MWREPLPPFFVSVAFKGVRFCVSLLDATLMRRLVSVASKGVREHAFSVAEKQKRPDVVRALHGKTQVFLFGIVSESLGFVKGEKVT